MAISSEHTKLLRFSVVGSVDNGKSTLIGRLLFDSKMLKDDQLESIKEDNHYNLARVTDGLSREREEGITIDVAYRYFQTSKRRYIICDCPGHEEFTPNMCSGTSQVDAAIVIVDSTTQVTTQTKRHLLISALLGARSLIICVNKLDLANNPEQVFYEYSKKIKDYLSEIEVETHFLPISALKGHNIVSNQDMKWFDGPTLLELLETLPVRADHVKQLRMTARVLATDLSSKTTHVRIDSGVLRPGQKLYCYPNEEEVKVNEIYQYGDLRQSEFGPGSVVNLTLSSTFDQTLLLAENSDSVRVSEELSAMIIWFSERPLKISDEIILKGRYNEVLTYVESLQSQIDVETKTLLENPHSVESNQLARLTLRTHQNQSIYLIENEASELELNEMILICPKTHMTLGALIIRDFLS